MTAAVATYDRYLTDFRALEASLPARQPAWLQALRRDAMDRFSALGLPTARHGNELWKYTNVGPIAEAAFSLDGESAVALAALRRCVPWHDSWATAVFVNGRYAHALSTAPASLDGARVLSLAGAARSEAGRVEPHLARHATFEDDGFVALNTAFLDDGAFIYIPDGVAVATPLHLVFASTGGVSPTVSHPRALIVAGAGSRLSVMESYVALGSSRRFTNAVTEIVAGEGAQVDHVRLLLEDGDVFHVGNTRVHQAGDSAFSSTAFERGAALARNDFRVLLDAPGASSWLRGLYITTGAQHLDNYLNIDHAKPHTNSRLYYKGILDGESKAIFGGTVVVRPGAVKVDAHQADKNLILSSGAEVDSKPSLEIYADDVKCGHGATAGAVAEDAIFYMRSRGLDLETASALLIKGFAAEVLDAVQIPHLRVQLERLVARALPGVRYGQQA